MNVACLGLMQLARKNIVTVGVVLKPRWKSNSALQGKGEGQVILKNVRGGPLENVMGEGVAGNF